MFFYKSVVVNFSIFSHAFPFNLIDFSQSTTMNNEVYLIKRRTAINVVQIKTPEEMDCGVVWVPKMTVFHNPNNRQQLRRIKCYSITRCKTLRGDCWEWTSKAGVTYSRLPAEGSRSLAASLSCSFAAINIATTVCGPEASSIDPLPWAAGGPGLRPKLGCWPTDGGGEYLLDVVE